jgi:hypothetical protein
MGVGGGGGAVFPPIFTKFDHIPYIKYNKNPYVVEMVQVFAADKTNFVILS